MVLWEITLATAYFLGLKRTYRLALKLQRRLISPKYPRIRRFLHGRTRAVFDVAIKVHQNVQQRDIEVGRNLGNWILRYLDKMKPSAQIRGTSPTKSSNGGSSSMNISKQVSSSSFLKPPESSQILKNNKSDRHLFSSSANVWQKPFPTIAMMMRSTKPAGTMNQYRHLCICGPEPLRPSYVRDRFEGVVRKDKMQWMLQNRQ